MNKTKNEYPTCPICKSNDCKETSNLHMAWSCIQCGCQGNAEEFWEGEATAEACQETEKTQPMLEADGAIHIYDLETGEEVACYEGLEVHYAMLKLQDIKWEERMMSAGWMKDNVNLTGWQRLTHNGKILHVSNEDAETWRNINQTPPPF